MVCKWVNGYTLLINQWSIFGVYNPLIRSPLILTNPPTGHPSWRKAANSVPTSNARRQMTNVGGSGPSKLRETNPGFEELKDGFVPPGPTKLGCPGTGLLGSQWWSDQWGSYNSPACKWGVLGLKPIDPTLLYTNFLGHPSMGNLQVFTGYNPYFEAFFSLHVWWLLGFPVAEKWSYF